MNHRRPVLVLFLLIAFPFAALNSQMFSSKNAKELHDRESFRRDCDAFEKALADFWEEKYGFYRCDRVLHAGVLAQRIGKDAAIERLFRHAQLDELDRDKSITVMILCRVLFDPRDGKPFRAPGLGAASFLGGSDYPEWPLEPIELVDGVPIYIVNGYTLAGLAETGTSYLRDCIDSCNWTSRLIEKSPDELHKAYESLLRSSKWRRELYDYEKEFLGRQARVQK